LLKATANAACNKGKKAFHVFFTVFHPVFFLLRIRSDGGDGKKQANNNFHGVKFNVSSTNEMPK